MDVIPGGSVPRQFGHIANVAVGAAFRNRRELQLKKVHPPGQAGISGGQKDGADSIVVAGAYRDDKDHGTYIIYTGAGGRDPSTGKQIEDQDISFRSNAALIKSQLEGYPVRVIRGAGTDAPYAPPSGYRYDGLFFVMDHWVKLGLDGYQVVQFRLEQILAIPQSTLLVDDRPGGPVDTRSVVVQRQVRSSMLVSKVKDLYGHRCQVCDLALMVEGGLYAEGAHIKALGDPHFGPDVLSNILCLCPNDHVRFDFGAIYLSDELNVLDRAGGNVIGPLRRVRGHAIDLAFVAYHRELRSNRRSSI
jgi:putative restriction endonuclease